MYDYPSSLNTLCSWLGISSLLCKQVKWSPYRSPYVCMTAVIYIYIYFTAQLGSIPPIPSSLSGLKLAAMPLPRISMTCCVMLIPEMCLPIFHFSSYIVHPNRALWKARPSMCCFLSSRPALVCKERLTNASNIGNQGPTRSPSRSRVAPGHPRTDYRGRSRACRPHMARIAKA